MKKCLLCFLISVVLLLSAAAPAYAAENGAAAAANSGTVVQAKAPSVYVFAAPQGATIASPQNQIGLGNFLISDLFLEDGEWLSVTVIPGALTHNRSGNTLPYQVQFNAPAVIGMSNIGQAYQATAVIDANALANAYRGTYYAVLQFRVISHPDGAIIWQGNTTLTVEVPYGAEWEEPQTPTSSTASQPVSSKPSLPSTVSTPSKPKPSSQSSAVSQGEPGQPPYMGAMAVKYGLPAAGLILLLLFVLIRVTGPRNRKDSG